MKKNGIWKEFFGRLFKKGDVAVKSVTVEHDVESSLLEFNDETLHYYRKFVKGNRLLSEDQARRKMTRNMALALPYKRDSNMKQHPRVWFSYGCLRFIVQDGTITWMENKLPVMKCRYKDYEKYEELNKQLGILPDVVFGYEDEHYKISS